MSKKIAVSLLAILVLTSAHIVQAQQTRLYRVGVIYEVGAIYAVVDGLKAALKDLGLQEGKQFVLELHDLKGDRNARA